MAHQSDTHRGVREQRRATHRISQRRERRRSQLRKGQTLVIFVLSFTVLLGFAGLTIDVARAYDLYGRMQRAAEAGALAGVLYMPHNYNTDYSDGNNAIKRALQETVKDRFGISVLGGLPASIPSTYFNCPNPSASFEVAVCPSPTTNNDLQVYVTQTLNLVLLNGLGVAPITLRASAQADYAPPIQINGRYNFIGDQIECSPGNSENTNSSYCATGATNGNRLSNYFAAMSGPAQLQETGDPYVYCSEGPTELTSGGNPSPDLNLGSDTYTTYNGQTTDHPQYSGLLGSNISQYCGKPSPGGNPGNRDYQPDGYAGEATKSSTLHAGGYNYQLNIQPNTGTTNLWIYNPYFIPGVANGPDQFADNGSPSFYRGPSGEGITNFDSGAGCGTPPCGHYDAPYFYFTTTVSVYLTANLYDRTADGKPVAAQTFQPYDAMPQDLAAHGCSSGQVFDPNSVAANAANWYHNRAGILANGAGCVSPPSCAPTSAATMSQWCKLQLKLDGSGGDAILQDDSIYRVVVEVQGLSETATNLLDPRGYDYSSSEVDGYGQHDYALKACVTSASGPYGNQGCGIGAKGVGQFNQPFVTFYGWNDFDIGFQLPLSTANPSKNYPQASCVSSNATPYACADLACIPTEFAGRTVTLRIFNPGDAPSGDMYLGIVPPDPTTASVSYSAYGAAVQTTNLDGDLVLHTRYSSGYSGYRPFNGIWLNVAITFFSNYVGDCALSTKLKGKSGFWQLAYISPNAGSGGNPNESMALSLTLIGSPQHLVSVG